MLVVYRGSRLGHRVCIGCRLYSTNVGSFAAGRLNYELKIRWGFPFVAFSCAWHGSMARALRVP